MLLFKYILVMGCSSNIFQSQGAFQIFAFISCSSNIFKSQAALQIFATEVKERKVCLDEGFTWGGEDVRMGEIFKKENHLYNVDTTPQDNAWPNWMWVWVTRETQEDGQGLWSGTPGSTSSHVSCFIFLLGNLYWTGRGKKDAGYVSYSKYPEVTTHI